MAPQALCFVHAEHMDQERVTFNNARELKLLSSLSSPSPHYWAETFLAYDPSIRAEIIAYGKH